MSCRNCWNLHWRQVRNVWKTRPRTKLRSLRWLWCLWHSWTRLLSSFGLRHYQIPPFLIGIMWLWLHWLHLRRILWRNQWRIRRHLWNHQLITRRERCKRCVQYLVAKQQFPRRQRFRIKRTRSLILLFQKIALHFSQPLHPLAIQPIPIGRLIEIMVIESRRVRTIAAAATTITARAVKEMKKIFDQFG